MDAEVDSPSRWSCLFCSHWRFGCWEVSLEFYQSFTFQLCCFFLGQLHSSQSYKFLLASTDTNSSSYSRICLKQFWGNVDFSTVSSHHRVNLLDRTSLLTVSLSRRRPRAAKPPSEPPAGLRHLGPVSSVAGGFCCQAGRWMSHVVPSVTLVATVVFSTSVDQHNKMEFRCLHGSSLSTLPRLDVLKTMTSVLI